METTTEQKIEKTEAPAPETAIPRPSIEAVEALVQKLARQRNELLAKRSALKERIAQAIPKANESDSKEDKAELAAARADLQAITGPTEAAIAEAKQAIEFLAELKNPTPPPTLPPIPVFEAPKKNIITRLFGAIDRALAREPNRTGHDLTNSVILDLRGGKSLIVSADELNQLVEWNRAWDNAQKVILLHTPDKARAAWMSHSSEVLQKAIRSGESLESLEGWSRGDWEEDFSQKLEAGKAEQRRLYAENISTASAVAKRFVDIGKKFADEREESEQEFHDRLGIAWPGGSAAVLGIRAAIAQAELRAKEVPESYASPRLIVPYLDL